MNPQKIENCSYLSNVFFKTTVIFCVVEFAFLNKGMKSQKRNFETNGQRKTLSLLQ